MTPFFSIIIPVYNVAPYLRECLDSVLAQTFGDWEAICVDDGSTDGSGAILDEYAAKDKRFRVLHQSNAGVSVARNVAIDIAKGWYLVFLDGDDMLGHVLLNSIYYLTADNPIDIIRYQASSLYDKLYSRNYSKEDYTIYNLNDVNQRAMAFKRIPNGILGGVCVRRECVGKIRFERFTNCEDVLFELCCFGESNLAAVTNGLHYFYRQRSDSVVHQVSIQHLESSLGVVCRTVDIAHNSPSLRAVYREVYKHCVGELGGHCWNLVELLQTKEDRQKGWRIYLDCIHDLFVERNLHPTRMGHVIYCVAGFLSWKMTACLFLRLPLLAKIFIVKRIVSRLKKSVFS